MQIVERKSKYKHKVIMARKDTGWSSPKVDPAMREWCEQSFGPGGRRHRWRFGWTHEDATFYFRKGADAVQFTLRWAS